MDQNEFEKLVSKALLILPKKIRQKMENVAICVEKRPSAEQLRKTGSRCSGLLLGLYEGIPQTFWGKGFGGNLPDKITIFQESIERYASSETELRSNRESVVDEAVASSSPFANARVVDELRSSPRFATARVIKELIKNVVWHEVAHHFGFSERGIKLLEQKRGT